MWLKMLIHLRGFCEVEFREEEERSVDSFGRVKPLSKLCEGQTGWILYVCVVVVSQGHKMCIWTSPGHQSNLYQKLHFTIIHTNKKTHLNPTPLWCFPTTQNITD